MPQQYVGGKGYKLQFSILGIGALDGKSLRVRVTRGDGTSFDKLTSTGDVQILNSSTCLVGVKLVDGDLNKSGKYSYQAFDETGGAFIPTEKKTFQVEVVLPAPV